MNWIEIPLKPFAKNAKWVECIVEIKNNLTGEIIEYPTEELLYDDDDEFPSTFDWEENNNSCDCNRRILFERAKGIENNWLNYECSEGKYSVNLKNKKDNYLYYREFNK